MVIRVDKGDDGASNKICLKVFDGCTRHFGGLTFTQASSTNPYTSMALVFSTCFILTRPTYE